MVLTLLPRYILVNTLPQALEFTQAGCGGRWRGVLLPGACHARGLDFCVKECISGMLCTTHAKSTPSLVLPVLVVPVLVVTVKYLPTVFIACTLIQGGQRQWFVGCMAIRARAIGCALFNRHTPKAVVSHPLHGRIMNYSIPNHT